MMQKVYSRPVAVSGEYAEKKTAGEIKIQEWDRQACVRRALKFGGMCWGLALVCVILPIVHFVLVPGFFIAGPLVARFMMKQESIVLGGEGACPYCAKTFPIIRCANRFPLTDVCTHCRKDVRIELA